MAEVVSFGQIVEFAAFSEITIFGRCSFPIFPLFVEIDFSLHLLRSEIQFFEIGHHFFHNFLRSDINSLNVFEIGHPFFYLFLRSDFTLHSPAVIGHLFQRF